MSPLIWLGAGIIFLVVELATLGLTTIWFLFGAIVAFFLNLAGVGLVWQMIAFIVVSALLILAIRPFATSKINNHTTKTNVDSLIGVKAKVTSDIDNIESTGTATVAGNEWTARSEDDSKIIKKDTIVTVVSVEGVKLIVKED